MSPEKVINSKNKNLATKWFLDTPSIHNTTIISSVCFRLLKIEFESWEIPCLLLIIITLTFKLGPLILLLN